jgi:outer membrane protein assembly factor BamB
MSFQYRELTAFDPKSRLRVDETYNISGAGVNSLDDPLGDLLEPTHKPGQEPGNSFQDFRTKGHITAGLTAVNSPTGKEHFICLNHKGEAILFSVSSGKIEAVWNHAIRGAFYRSAVIVDDVAFCVTKQGLLVGLQLKWDEEGNALEPELVWQRALNQTVFSKPISTGKVLIVATMNSIHAYDCYTGGAGETGKLGKKLWEEPIAGSVSSPEFGKGRIFIGCEDRHIYAYSYSTDNLSQAWKVKTDGAIRSKPYLTRKGNYVLVGSMDGVFYALDPNTGKVLWSFPARSPIHSDIISYIEGNDEYYVFGNDAGVVYCLNLYGKEQWKYSTNGRIRSEFYIHNGILYFGSEDNSLYGLNQLTGKLVFKYNTDGNINGNPLVFGNRIFVGSTDSFVHGIFI